jgi:F-type H+-transporting ATPase subunit b
MTLDPTTFILQILNFLVLLWLLHRFVYAPLRAAITQRQADADAAAAAFQEKCTSLEADKTALQQQREGMDAAKRAADTALAESIAVERTARLAVLEKELTAAREQGLARIEMQLAGRMAESSQQLQQQVDATLRAHLQRLACPALEAVLLDQFVTDVDQLDASTRTTLQQLDWADDVTIDTVFPVSDAQKNRLLAALTVLRGELVVAQWHTSDALIAGVRVGLDGRELELSLGHSLQPLPTLILAALSSSTSLSASAI